MTPAPPRLVVAVPTYRRPEDIARLVPDLLDQLDGLAATGAVRGRVLVVDNDPPGTARAALQPWLPRITYVVESRPGISAARNRALDEACDDDLLAFIDDDERPGPAWLERLLTTRREFGAIAVAGRVRSIIDGDVDPWIRAGGFFERRHRLGVTTGTPITEAATNNLLLDLHAVRTLSLRFAPELGLLGGEDSLFTKTLTGAGARLVWCAEAEVTEVVPAHRLTRRWVLLRQLSSGNSATLGELRLAPSRVARTRVRARYLGRGLARVLAGLARAALGVVTRHAVHEARGARTVARGAGMAGGAIGWRYQEYRRPASRVRRRGPRAPYGAHGAARDPAGREHPGR